jgi:RNA polymerase sigma-70 factor (ECF subfamily)
MLTAARPHAAPHRALPMDLELVRRVRAGDAEARETLVRKHIAAMLVTAARILGGDDHHAARAAVCEAFARAFESLAEYDGTQPLSRWLQHAAVRAAVARCPAPAYEAAIDAWLPSFDADGQRRDVRPAWAPATLELARHDAAWVRAMVAMLPDELRVVLILRDIEVLDAEETAAVLRTSTATVASRLHRARMALRHLLERNLAGA